MKPLLLSSVFVLVLATICACADGLENIALVLLHNLAA